MVNSKYVVISNSDGETFVSVLSKAEFLRDLSSGSFGENPEFMTELPAATNGNTNYWGGKILILSAEVVVPKQVEVVKAWGVD